MVRGACWPTVQRVAKPPTWLVMLEGTIPSVWELKLVQCECHVIYQVSAPGHIQILGNEEPIKWDVHASEKPVVSSCWWWGGPGIVTEIMSFLTFWPSSQILKNVCLVFWEMVLKEMVLSFKTVGNRWEHIKKHKQKNLFEKWLYRLNRFFCLCVLMCSHVSHCFKT